jgi:hypothetical protein
MCKTCWIRCLSALSSPLWIWPLSVQSSEFWVRDCPTNVEEINAAVFAPYIGKFMLICLDDLLIVTIRHHLDDLLIVT